LYLCAPESGPADTAAPKESPEKGFLGLRPPPTFVYSISNFNSNQIGFCGARSYKQLFDLGPSLENAFFLIQLIKDCEGKHP